MADLVGKTVRKQFIGFGTISGTVKSYDASLGYFEIVYEDGDSEEMEFAELTSILLDHQPIEADLDAKQKQIQESRPKKRRRVSGGSSKGNSVSTSSFTKAETVTEEETLENHKPTTLFSNPRGLDLNVSLQEDEEEEKCFVTKPDLNANLVEVVMEDDLGLSFSTPPPKLTDHTTNSSPPSKLTDHTTNSSCFEDDEDDRDLGGIPRDSAYLKKICPRPPDVSTRQRRKQNQTMTPETTTKTKPQTVLRRSARRASSAANGNAALSLSSSIEIDLLSDTMSSGSKNEEVTELKCLPPRLELPPSSKNLNVSDSCVLDLFLVYSFLRSFSALLFLSPFSVESFAGAVNCKFANSLIDSIHYSLLRTLKLHLEFLSNEVSQAASTCLRNLNWELLDVVTWPVYLADYLLICGSRLKPGFELNHLRFLVGDYYKQSPALKIELLRCLCDDVMEIETVQMELNRRVQASELDMDADRIANIELNKKRKDQMDDGGGSCLTQEVVNETTDWNSDECCLCKMDGNLICCDGCPAAYHTRCVGVTKDQLPEGDWYCPECLSTKYDTGAKITKSVRGAEILGVDPYGRPYFSCCGYLLVSNSCDQESSYNYYNRDDLKTVVETLKSSSIIYGGIISAISLNWNTKVNSTGAKDHQNSQFEVLDLNDQVIAVAGQNDTSSKTKGFDLENGSHSIPTNSPSAKYECHAKISQFVDGSQVHQRTEVDCNGYAEIFKKSETPKESHSTVGESTLKHTNYEVKHEKKRGVSASGLTKNPVKEASAEMQFNPESYVNCYDFARTAASIAQELIPKLPDGIKEVPILTLEDIISAQTKAILKNSTNFCWLNIHTSHQKEQRENCGWCFSCRTPTDSGDCLFNTTCKKSTSEGFNNGPIVLRSRSVRKSHLYAIVCHILSIEERLSGLLLGPWKNPNYSKSWHKSVLNATDVRLVKQRLLTLESNLRRVALSAEWLKQVDTVIVGSASHVMTTPVQVSSSKQMGGRKRARLVDGENKYASVGAARPGIIWWRGGKVSRQLFNCKVLPHSLASKGGRQAGWRKIPGISYPEGLEFAKRSKDIAWRASVETSTSLAHLAYQVRELDSSIRWDDLENTQGFSHLSKESQKSMKLFKKVTIRRKHIDGSGMKYLLDFGKRKTIPKTVTRNGVMLEVSASERKKYWLDESLVPLHILKAYEEKKLARVSNKVKPEVLDEGGKLLDRSSRKRGLLCLLSKAEKFDYYQCGHCKKDVLIREAVSCLDCEGFFHKRHARKSEHTSMAGCTYICHKCGDRKYVKTPVKSKPKKNLQSQKSKKSSVEGRPRRSVKKVNYMPVKSKKRGGAKKSKKIQLKKGQSKKSKKGKCWHKGRRTQVYHAYWLNGLRLTRKPNDSRVVHFTEGKLIMPHSNTNFLQPTCSLCCERGHRSALIYVNCENCQEWFHGEAFGLTSENSSSIFGFKCHTCRQRNSPTCPYLEDTTVNNIQLQEEDNAAAECVGNAPVTEELSCPRKNREHNFSSAENSQVSQEYAPKGQKSEDNISYIITRKQNIDLSSNDVLKEQKIGEVQDIEHKEKAYELFNSEQKAETLPDSSHEEQITNGTIDSNKTSMSAECKDKL